MTETVQNLALGKVFPSKFNLRKVDEKSPQFKELADDIKTRGILQALLVRPIKGGYELVDGHHRHAAAKKVGLKDAPALIKPMTDEQAEEARLAAALHHRDLKPLEEAYGFKLLSDRGTAVPELAAKVGRPAGYVYQRLKLNSLHAKVKDALAKDELSLASALVLVKLSNPEDQAEALKTGQKHRYDAAHEYERLISNYICKLSDAPWPMSMSNLNKTGPCAICDTRTSTQKLLFDEGKKSDDRCTDRACWVGKLKAWGKLALAQAKKDARYILNKQETAGLTSYNGEWVELDSALSYPLTNSGCRTWRELLKGIDSLVTGLADKGDGGVVECVERKKAEKAAKAAGKLKDPSASRAEVTPEEREAKRLKKERAAKMEADELEAKKAMVKAAGQAGATDLLEAAALHMLEHCTPAKVLALMDLKPKEGDAEEDTAMGALQEHVTGSPMGPGEVMVAILLAQVWRVDQAEGLAKALAVKLPEVADEPADESDGEDGDEAEEGGDE
jgi:ParB/RepB/Spo0J family partition protein